ncbi:MAG: sulfite exporter TauE/SafE family protein [Acutalibacteraceae bacterium]|nr:sulfite exporter TauE/SafE family protein [Acutalibacteraceae bacterium]
MNLVWLLIASFGAGLLGSMGMGGGGILVIFLSLCTDIPQANAQGINLLFFIPIAVLSVIMYQRQKLIKWKIAIPFAIAGICFSFLGAYVANSIDPIWLRRGFGILLLIMGIRELLNKEKGHIKKDG